MSYTKDYIPKSKSKRPGSKITPHYITIHNTGNPKSTARNERSWLTNPNNTVSASFHIVIDENEAIEVIPLNEKAYHSGSSDGNNFSIGIEICESGNQEKTMNNAITLIAQMLMERGWSTAQLKTHKDWSGKNCPRLILPFWSDFINAIELRIKRLKNIPHDHSNASKGQIAKNDYSKDAVSWAIAQKISDGTRLDDACTRREVITMMHRMGGTKND